MTAAPQEDPDSDLVRRLRQDEEREQAYREAFERYWRRVAGLFQGRGHGRERAKELTQETFLRVFRNMDRYRGELWFGVWVLRVAESVHHSELRRVLADKRFGHEVSIDGEPSNQPLQLAAAGPSAEEEVLRQEEIAALRQALAELPPKMRRCVELRVHHDLKFREIARELGISIETVKAHLYQARKQLRGRLARWFPDAGF